MFLLTTTIVCATASALRGIRCEADYTIAVWQHGGARLEFMYSPIRRTVIEGLSRRSVECGYSVTWGFGYNSTEYRRDVLERLTSGDVVIYIGVIHEREYGADCVDTLKPRGVHCIHYQSEPRPNLQGPGNRIDVDEVWDYSHANKYTARVSRVVPPGYLAGNSPWIETDFSPQLKSILFIGAGVKSNSNWERDRCWQQLRANPDVGGLLENEESAWTEDDWANLARRNQTIFLNFHKRCLQDTDIWALESVRLSMLLSYGAVVVTQAAHHEDVALYEGIVIAESQFLESRWSQNTLDLIKDPDRLAEWRRRAFALFRARFDPLIILMRARVWDETPLLSGETAHFKQLT